MTSKKRKYGDLSARPLPTEGEDLIDDVFAAFTGQRPQIEEVEPVHEPPQPSAPQIPTPTNTIPNHPQPSPSIAPKRDFNRRANSLERDALPAGAFPGSSKKLYDALYLRTIGAVTPRASIKATKRDLMDWSGIRNVKTVETHMRYLVGVGLIVREGENGDREGFSYGVRLPESAGIPTPTNTIPNHPQPSGPVPNHDRKTVMEGDQKSVLVGVGQVVESQEDTVLSKTSFKTNTERSDDDEAFAGFLAAVKQATKELTGREPSPAEAARWAELADVLVMELRIAAGRTTVSSVPSFLAEHLRRRLFKKDRKTMNEELRAGGEVQQSAKAVDASKCPDCFGTGMYYPEGFEKGVARCEHKSLVGAQAETS